MMRKSNSLLVKARSETNQMADFRKRLSYYTLTALALSIGWGIRGNFGHEYGAMIPGALAAMAAVLLSGRSDWVRLTPFFAMFGRWGGRSAAASRTCRLSLTRTPDIRPRCSTVSPACL